MERNDLIERARNAADNIGRELSSNSMMPPEISGVSDLTAEFAADALRALASAHEATIASLSEALAEAEKKGAEAVAEICEVMADEDDVLAMREGLEDWEIFQHRHAERRLREAARRFRDLSQGGQHG